MCLKCYLSILLSVWNKPLLAMSWTKSQEKQENKTKENREQKTGTMQAGNTNVREISV